MGDSRDTSVSRQTLEATYARAVPFLRGVGTSSILRARMGTYGDTDKAHAEGWAGVLAAGGYQAPVPATVNTTDSRAHDGPGWLAGSGR